MGSHTSTVPSPRTFTPSPPSLFRVVPRRADDTLAFLLPVKPVFPYGTDRGPGGVGLCLSTPQWAVPDTCPGAHPGVRAGSGPLPSCPRGPHRGQQSRRAELSPLPAAVVWAAGRTNTFTPLPGQSSSHSGCREGRGHSTVCTQGSPSQLPAPGTRRPLSSPGLSSRAAAFPSPAGP